MKKEGIIVLGGLTALGILMFVLAKKAKAEVPPEPQPGLANVYGTVTDAATGKPLSGVKVGIDWLITTTNGDGWYLFKNLEPGDYTLEFAKEGYAYVRRDLIVPAGNSRLDMWLAKEG